MIFILSEGCVFASKLFAQTTPVCVKTSGRKKWQNLPEVSISLSYSHNSFQPGALFFLYILFLQSLVWNTADSVYLGREEAKKPVALYALVKPFPLNRMGKLLVSSCICKVIIVKLVQQFAAANAEEKKTTVCNNSWLFSNSFFISPSQTLLLQLRGGDDLSP